MIRRGNLRGSMAGELARLAYPVARSYLRGSMALRKPAGVGRRNPTPRPRWVYRRRRFYRRRRRTGRKPYHIKRFAHRIGLATSKRHEVYSQTPTTKSSRAFYREELTKIAGDSLEINDRHRNVINLSGFKVIVGWHCTSTRPLCIRGH
jgi:hypothetical protein